jgi:hypothetical protein
VDDTVPPTDDEGNNYQTEGEYRTDYEETEDEGPDAKPEDKEARRLRRKERKEKRQRERDRVREQRDPEEKREKKSNSVLNVLRKRATSKRKDSRAELPTGISASTPTLPSANNTSSSSGVSTAPQASTTAGGASDLASELAAIKRTNQQKLLHIQSVMLAIKRAATDSTEVSNVLRDNFARLHNLAPSDASSTESELVSSAGDEMLADIAKLNTAITDIIAALTATSQTLASLEQQQSTTTASQ